MKRFFTLTTVVALAAVPMLLWGQRSHDLPRLNAEKDASGKYGYYDGEGNCVMPCIFDWALTFGRSDYVSMVKSGDRYYVIDRLGNLIVHSSFDTMPEIYDNIMLVGDYGEQYVADLSGCRLSSEGWNVQPLTCVGMEGDPVLFSMKMAGDRHNVCYVADLSFDPAMKKDVNTLKLSIYCPEIVEYGIHDTGSGYVCGLMNAAGDVLIEGDGGWSMDVKPLSYFTDCDKWIEESGMAGFYDGGEKDMTVFVMFSRAGKSKIYDIAGQLVVPLQNGTNMSKLLDRNLNKYVKPYLHRVSENTNRYAERVRKPYEVSAGKAFESDVIYRIDGAVAVADVIAGKVDLDAPAATGAGAAVSGRGAAVAANNGTSRLGDFASGSGGESGKSAEDKVIESITDFFSSVESASAGSGSTSGGDKEEDGVQGMFDMAAAMSGATADKSSGNKSGGGSATASYTAEECYRRGMDAMKENDFAAAAQWLDQAAAKGCTEACRPLAECYDLTSSPVYDEEKAVRWYLKAAENAEKGSYDFWYSCYRLGFYYEFGKGGMDRDLEQARALFVLSRDNTYAGNRATMDDCIARVEGKMRAESGSDAEESGSVYAGVKLSDLFDEGDDEAGGEDSTAEYKYYDSLPEEGTLPEEYNIYYGRDDGDFKIAIGARIDGSDYLVIFEAEGELVFRSDGKVLRSDEGFTFCRDDDASIRVFIRRDWKSMTFDGKLYDMALTQKEMEEVLDYMGK